MGVAVAVDDGLIVPVVRDVDQLSISGINRAIAEVAARARAGKLRLDDYGGSTFTIDNTGWFGSNLTMPIINVPEVAILTMETITKRPSCARRPRATSIAIRPVMNMVLAIDHRANDGAQAAAFLRAIKAWLEAIGPETVGLLRAVTAEALTPTRRTRRPRRRELPVSPIPDGRSPRSDRRRGTRSPTARSRRLRRHPDWIRARMPSGENYHDLKGLLRGLTLNTVCEEARCPNIGECWDQRTATIMILGDTCTRACGFCAVKTGRPTWFDDDEPRRVAEAIGQLGLEHVVVTVGRPRRPARRRRARLRRDDPPLRDTSPGDGRRGPDPGLQRRGRAAAEPSWRPGRTSSTTTSRPSDGSRSRSASAPAGTGACDVLARAKAMAAEIGYPVHTKSSLMVGLGEERAELTEAFAALREVDCDILTIGQYLRPSLQHLPLERYYHPDEFAEMKAEALALGLQARRVGAAGPLQLPRPRPGPGRRAEAAPPPGDRRRGGPGRPARGLNRRTPVSVEFEPVKLGPTADAGSTPSLIGRSSWWSAWSPRWSSPGTRIPPWRAPARVPTGHEALRDVVGNPRSMPPAASPSPPLAPDRPAGEYRVVRHLGLGPRGRPATRHRGSGRSSPARPPSLRPSAICIRGGLERTRSGRAGDAPSVDIEPDDQTVVAVGITFPPRTPRSTRGSGSYTPTGSTGSTRRPSRPSPSGGGFLYRVVDADGPSRTGPPAVPDRRSRRRCASAVSGSPCPTVRGRAGSPPSRQPVGPVSSTRQAVRCRACRSVRS